MKTFRLVLLILLVAAVAALAQRRSGRRGWGGDDFSGTTYTEGGVSVDPDTVRTAREIGRASCRERV